MRFRNNLHRPVFLVHVIECEPDRDTVLGRHGPVIRVLMPADGGGAEWLFDKKVAGPHEEVGSQDAFDQIENVRVQTNVVKIATGLVPLAEVFRGFAGVEEVEQFRQLSIELGHLRAGVDRRQANQIALRLISADLFRGEPIVHQGKLPEWLLFGVQNLSGLWMESFM